MSLCSFLIPALSLLLSLTLPTLPTLPVFSLECPFD